MWEWLGLWPWAPNGAISPSDEAVMTGQTARNIRQPGEEYRRWAVAQKLDIGDEAYGGNPYQYVPVLFAGWGQIETMQHFTVDEPYPVKEQSPSLRQIAQNAYSGLDATWRAIAGAPQSDWDAGEPDPGLGWGY